MKQILYSVSSELVAISSLFLRKEWSPATFYTYQIFVWMGLMCILNERTNPDAHLNNVPGATESAWKEPSSRLREGGEAGKQVSPLYIHFKAGQMKVSKCERPWESREAPRKPDCAAYRRLFSILAYFSCIFSSP